MATVTLLTLRTTIREELGIEQTNEVLTDVELNRRINTSGNKLYNRLVKADQDYFLTSTTFTISSGNTFTVPAGIYKVRGLDFAIQASLDRWLDVPPYAIGFRNQSYDRAFRLNGASQLMIMPSSLAIGSYQLWYVPAFAPMVADTDTIETISGFERLIVAEVCAWARNKQELDPSVFLAEVAKLEKEIYQYARERLDVGPRTVRDVRPRQGGSLSTDYDYPWRRY